MTKRKILSVCLCRRSAILLCFFLWMFILMPQASAAFGDVPREAWYYADVERLRAAGVVNGYPDGTFRPDAAVSYAEAMKMVLLAAGNSVAQGEGAAWYAPYLEYARAHGIADPDAAIDPNAPITRDGSAELIVRAMGLPLDVFRETSPFADSENVYAITLYGVGIFKGEPEGNAFYFRGPRALSRAELAALVVRMMQYASTRPAPHADVRLMPSGCTLPEAPKTVEDFIETLIYLSVNGIDSHTFIYRGVDAETVKNDYVSNLVDAFPTATDLCRESVIYYHYYNINLAYAPNYVSMTLSLRARDYSGEECRAMFAYSRDAAEQAVREILAAGPLDADAPQRDFARRCTEWLATHCRYAEGDGLLDQYAYSVFRDGSSVCSGYTAAYNLMLKLGGIKCISMTGTALIDGMPASHAWTIAELDGEVRFIDATWCDPVNMPDDHVSYAYFALDEDTFSRDHTPEWDWRLYWDFPNR